jgi:hypothetical protein
VKEWDIPEIADAKQLAKERDERENHARELARQNINVRDEAACAPAGKGVKASKAQAASTKHDAAPALTSAALQGRRDKASKSGVKAVDGVASRTSNRSSSRSLSKSSAARSSASTIIAASRPPSRANSRASASTESTATSRASNRSLSAVRKKGYTAPQDTPPPSTRMPSEHLMTENEAGDAAPAVPKRAKVGGKPDPSPQRGRTRNPTTQASADPKRAVVPSRLAGTQRDEKAQKNAFNPASGEKRGATPPGETPTEAQAADAKKGTTHFFVNAAGEKLGDPSAADGIDATKGRRFPSSSTEAGGYAPPVGAKDRRRPSPSTTKGGGRAAPGGGIARGVAASGTKEDVRSASTGGGTAGGSATFGTKEDVRSASTGGGTAGGSAVLHAAKDRRSPAPGALTDRANSSRAKTRTAAAAPAVPTAGADLIVALGAAPAIAEVVNSLGPFVTTRHTTPNQQRTGMTTGVPAAAVKGPGFGSSAHTGRVSPANRLRASSVGSAGSSSSGGSQRLVSTGTSALRARAAATTSAADTAGPDAVAAQVPRTRRKGDAAEPTGVTVKAAKKSGK